MQGAQGCIKFCLTVASPSLHIIEEGLDSLLGGNESCQIHPLSQPGLRGRFNAFEQAFDAGTVNFLKAGDQAVAKEFLDTYSIEFLTAMQRAVADLCALVSIDIAGGAAELLQFIKDIKSVEHLINRVGREEVEVHLIQPSLRYSAVALRPLLGIAHGTHGTEINSWCEVSLTILLNQVGERKQGGIGIGGMAAHDE